MCSLERKFRKIFDRRIEECFAEDKKRGWDKLVREGIGCPGCQFYNKKKKRCKNGYQANLEAHNGIPCEGIKPVELK